FGPFHIKRCIDGIPAAKLYADGPTGERAGNEVTLGTVYQDHGQASGRSQSPSCSECPASRSGCAGVASGGRRTGCARAKRPAIRMESGLTLAPARGEVHHDA